MREPETDFGRELRTLRRKAGYSQAELAKKADNITASYISQLETGKKIPTPRVIRSLSGPLEVTPNRLLGKIGMVEMDFASTLAVKREQVNSVASDLTQEQIEEVANYLTYLEFKASILSSSQEVNFDLITKSPVMQILFKERHRKEA